MRITLPIKTVSESNARGHWAGRSRRTKVHRIAALLACRTSAPIPKLPVVVTLTRCAPRPLDDDNLRGAMKATRDGIADFYEVNDRDERIDWRYNQMKTRDKLYEVIVDIEESL